ncbi:ankyrin repeat domain-containing protein [Corallococcus exiguus]|uniref:ankyrin repeat domain-containing protein n=1 Tax=Corallococcus exiguus TaxID=83462 RepID=UPI001A90946B|nr:ankyrin repeat domain-containing protein [Corallococcus exiguus]MBN8471842.1 ankyrin repeat domain-containing protein [Corallococcus exiguus]
MERSNSMAWEERIDPRALATCELYVVRVSKVHDQGATFTRPPRVALTVEQVILGEPQTQPLPAVFSASLGDHFCGNGAMEEAQQRAQEPVPGPALGKRLIVAGGWNQARTWFEVTSSNRWPFTDTKLTDLTTALNTAREKEPDFDARIEKRRKEDLAAQTDPDLLRAVDQGDRVRTQALLEGGARPNTSVYGDFSALQKAVKRKDTPMVALLMRHMPRDTQDPEALRLALTDLDLVRTLLEGGLSWRGRERSNGPMNDAASMGACEALTLLLKAGGDPNAVGQDQQTVLHAATRSSQGLRCVPLLLEAGAKAEVSSGGWTPLLYAAHEKYSPEAELAIRALVAHGARVNRKTPQGMGLLEVARKSPEMVALLQSLGAR